MSYFAIYNPASGHFDIEKIYYAVRYFKDKYSINLQLVESEYQGFAKDFFKDVNPEIVIIFGGDGFIRDVIEGLYINKREPSVYFFPMGTVNILCREFKIGTNFNKALKKFDNDSSRLPLNIGIVGEKIFILMIGLGFDAFAVKNLNLNLKKKIGKFAYIISGLKGMFNNYEVHEIFFDNKNFKTQHIIVSIGNMYAGSFKLYKKKIDKFKILMSNGLGFMRFIYLLIHIFTPLKLLKVYLSDLVKINNVNDVQLDGDYFNFKGKDLVIRFAKTKICVIKPRN